MTLCLSFMVLYLVLNSLEKGHYTITDVPIVLVDTAALHLLRDCPHCRESLEDCFA